MTDYLEEHLERTNALLEQVKRMEGSLSSPAGQAAQAGEGGFSPVPAEGSPSQPEEASPTEQAVNDLKKQVDQIEKRVDNPEPAPLSREEDKKEAATPPVGPEHEPLPRSKASRSSESEKHWEPVPKQPHSNAERAEKNTLPLTERLEELDRAAAGLASGAAVRKAALDQLFPSRSAPQGGAQLPGLSSKTEWEQGSGYRAPAPSPAGETAWAELADRAFRRDSRRYDRGFFLY